MKVRLDGWIILLSVVLNVGAFLKVSGQSQQYPPSFISDNFIYQNWTAKDGLPVNSVSSVTQTSDGYIWLGTEDGLVRFDGLNFKTFRTNEFPGLRYNRIRGVSSFDDKLLILNSNMEFITYDGIKFDLIPDQDSLSGNVYTGLIKNDSERILMPTTSGQVYTISNDEIELLQIEDIQSLKKRKRGDYHWQAYQEELYLNDQLIIDFQNQINELIIDREGTVWVATYSKGLYKVRPNLFETYSIEEGMPNRNVYPVMGSKDGKLWAGTYGGGIATITHNNVTDGFLFEGVSSEIFIQSIIERNNGDILVSVLDEGVYKYSGDRIFMEYPSPGEGTVFCFFEDSDDKLWAGTSSGLYQYTEEGNWEIYTISSFSNARIKAIVEAPDKSMWLATSGLGLIHINEGNIFQIGKNGGLSSNLLRSIWIDKYSENEKNYNVWVGSEERGLSILPVQSGNPVPLAIKTIGKEEGLFGDVIHSIIPDDFERIWMSSNQGLFWVYKKDIDEFVKGNIEKVISTGYTEVDGLRNREANGGIQPAGIRDKNGTLWFPTQDGVVKVDPSTISRNLVIAPVHINKIKTDKGVINEINESIDLDLGDRNLEFYFNTLSFISPEKNNVRYRLFGFDEDWISAENKRSARYTNIPPGNYRFRVIGTNNDGIWNQQGALLEVNIPAYFYESSWFLFLIIFLIGIQVALIFMLANKKAKKTVQKKEAELFNAKQLIMMLESKLHDHDSLKKAMLMNLSNDLREPVISLREQVKKEREPIKKIIERETFEMLSYIDQLLLLTEIELDEIQIHPKPEDLVEVVKSGIALHKNKANNSDPVIEFTSNSEEITISLDVRFVFIIIKNLISRAVNHTSVSKIRVQIIEESSVCTVKISEDGKSIEQKELKSIFNLFNTHKRNRKKEKNLGIELPLVAKLVELHHASIVVHSVPDSGNTFSVIFKKGHMHFNKPPAETQLVKETSKVES